MHEQGSKKHVSGSFYTIFYFFLRNIEMFEELKDKKAQSGNIVTFIPANSTNCSYLIWKVK
jgi:hypothetical protein